MPELLVAETEKGWRVDGHRCQDCHAEIPLVSQEKPGRLALRIAPLIICDECDARMELRDQTRQNDEEKVIRLAASGLPLALQGIHWREFDGSGEGRKAAALGAHSWAVHGRQSLLLYGGIGVGKTFLAAIACWERLSRGPVTWVSVSQLVTQASAAFGSTERARAVRVLAGKGPIVLDDLDKVKPSDWVKAQLFAAIDARDQSGAPVIVTTNLDADEIADKLSDAIASRVASFQQFHLSGRDRRQEEM